MTAALFKRPGWWRALSYTILGGGVRPRPGRPAARDLRPAHLADRADRLPAGRRPGDHRAARVPDRDRLLRLLAALGDRCADLPGRARARAPRRLHLEGLLQGQHRSQGDRDPVPGHHLLFLLRRRPDRDDHAGRARPARDADRRSGDVQRALLDPRRDHDLRLRDPGLLRDRELRAAADDRGAGHGVPAPERAQLLDAADRRDPFPRQLLRPRRRLRRRLDRATRRSPPGRR